MAPKASNASARDEADIRRLGRALRSVHVLETLGELELESGVPTRRIVHLVKKYPEQLARVARAQSIEYSGYTYQPSGAGPFGHYGGGVPGASHPAVVYVNRPKRSTLTIEALTAACPGAEVRHGCGGLFITVLGATCGWFVDGDRVSCTSADDHTYYSGRVMTLAEVAADVAGVVAHHAGRA